MNGLGEYGRPASFLKKISRTNLIGFEALKTGLASRIASSQ
jgi:hypothetical protein